MLTDIPVLALAFRYRPACLLLPQSCYGGPQIASGTFLALPIPGAMAILAAAKEHARMCDFSLHHTKSRPAKVGDRLTTRNFGTGTNGFAAPDDPNTAVCLLPGTELAFAREVSVAEAGFFGTASKTIGHTVAIFRQINKQQVRAHHDALEFPDRSIVLLTMLYEGQEAIVLQLPAQPKTLEEAQVQTRVAYAG